MGTISTTGSTGDTGGTTAKQVPVLPVSPVVLFQRTKVVCFDLDKMRLQVEHLYIV
jgi:hypothetical protein